MNNKYVKLIAKPNEYYDDGTEVFGSFEHPLPARRFTIQEWEDCENGHGWACVVGFREGNLDREISFCDEFEVEYNVEYKEVQK